MLKIPLLIVMAFGFLLTALGSIWHLNNQAAFPMIVAGVILLVIAMLVSVILDQLWLDYRSVEKRLLTLQEYTERRVSFFQGEIEELSKAKVELGKIVQGLEDVRVLKDKVAGLETMFRVSD